MNASFNLLTEPWIPTVTLEGEREKLGLLDTLKNAHKLKGISDASPLIEYGLHRFLSVLLMDAFRPGSQRDLKRLLKKPCFPTEEIDAYISQCQAEGVSFDLFDPARPFLQTPMVPQWDKTPKPIANLDYTMPSGNNHTHFDHRKQAKVKVPYDEAARLLLAAQIFSTAGLKGPSNVYGAPPFFLIVKGKSLFHTLVYSLIPINRIDLPFDEPPVFWRNTEPVEPKKDVFQTSWLYGMLFPARRITLIPAGGGVAEAYISQGLNYRPKESWKDPFVTYRATKEAGFAPWRPNAEKAIWRNLNDLVDTERAPQVLRQFLDMDQGADEAFVTLYGVQTNQASYLGTFHYDLAIPAGLAVSERRVDAVTHCIESCENMARGLKRSLTGIEGIPEITATQAAQDFFSACETEFWTIIPKLETEELGDVAQKWQEFLIKTVWKIRDNAMQGLFLSARDMHNAALFAREIHFVIHKLKGGKNNG